MQTEKKDLITVVVPVYNVKDYLVKCVDSIVGQTYTDLEILLVDDGSTDVSGDMCDEIALTDDRIRVIHKQNGGLSSARNAGIAEAKGSYISFIDSDDYVADDMIETLYRNLILEDADLSICGIYNVYKDKEIEISEPYYAVMEPEKAVTVAYAGSFSAISAVNKLYKTSLFEDVRFPEGKIFEDAFITVDIFMRCQKIVLTSEQKYYYFHREESITTKNFSPKMFDIIEAYQKNYKLIKQNYPKILWVAEGRLFWANLYVLDRMIVSEEKKYQVYEDRIVAFLKKHRGKVLRNRVLNRSRKISFLVLLCSRRLYKILVSANLKKNYKAN